MELRRRLGVDGAQFIKERLRTLLGKALLQLDAQFPTLLSCGKVNAADKGVQVKPCASHQNGQLAAGENILHPLIGLGNIFRHRPVLCRLGDAHHVMGDARHLLGRRGSSAHLHAAVELHGVHADHLAVEAQCQCYTHFRFSRGGGTHHAEDCRHLMFSLCALK